MRPVSDILSISVKVICSRFFRPWSGSVGHSRIVHTVVGDGLHLWPR